MITKLNHALHLSSLYSQFVLLCVLIAGVFVIAAVYVIELFTRNTKPTDPNFIGKAGYYH
ncbi:hypothetical protein [Mucilaginibacter aquaedulcis]|jgi:hypothetical protein|uniref:hypothetical protein n=1 Tax=Mucilaginibacter aquaedulcis TaxID=1187081 RepID=UPI0025B4C30C|nr:hypothetical protein [Mucilaginibacter aquaedulcis]MDN3549832.1 hypothetical protein [Mucilaginibacter aquaedulcis]